jgi:hypothetical protein
MAEMKSCSIAELMGISKHKYFVSNSELLWWQARSTMKPLPALRADLFHAEDLVFASNQREIKEKQAFREWFKKDQTKAWEEAAKRVSERQKQLDLENGRKNN